MGCVPSTAPLAHAAQADPPSGRDAGADGAAAPAPASARRPPPIRVPSMASEVSLLGHAEAFRGVQASGARDDASSTDGASDWSSLTL
jgi:hypothetical protein